ncbi:MAG: hypothetical protein A3H96_21570 [Acidobacteria bacterium RIFCSPLOWO2_02_FULL_67_36]|nr:MAG: hypothetical protein A3H96_21570 [Acidobacteria bacterium RIFCSPLOWO2_02_FULL_67_36]OFW21181.1 MAG: hypothetical protein A3G21_11165 [Acidobacteria bacterium RIFCSPLOWO2_12_FULL_66_21]
MVGAVHSLGGQEIPLRDPADFLSLVQRGPSYLVREWLFLAYAVFAVGEGVGLYYLTRPARSIALWALVAFSAGILIGIVQDAAVVAFVRQFPSDYAAADAMTRRALEPLARTVVAIIDVQQAVANVLLGVGGALYSVAILRTGVASRWFGLLGVPAAVASVFFGVVTAAAPRLSELQAVAEYAFGLVVLWDLGAAIVMLGFRDDARQDGHANSPRHRGDRPAA